MSNTEQNKENVRAFYDLLSIRSSLRRP